MKRIFSFLLALVPLMAFAQQFNGSGWYRAQSQASSRYLSVVDPKKIYRNGSDVFLGGLNCKEGFDSGDNVVSNPASICWFQQKKVEGQIIYINLIGQGLDFDQRMSGSASLAIRTYGSGYLLYGSGSGLVRYIYDNQYNSEPYVPYTAASGSAAYLWNMLPVNDSEGQYFGVLPDVTASADGSHWATMYASFPFVPASDMKVYTVSKVENGYAVIKEVAGTVPSVTPLLIRCGSASAALNKLSLKAITDSPAAISGNQLRGNYYCYIDASRKKEHNVVAYDPATMRMLGTDADGKPAFVKSDIQYLPANKCYLPVSSSAPATLKIITEDEYIAGISTVTIDDVQNGLKGVYTISGQLVGNSTDGLSKGVYIVNGKKVVVK